MLKQYLRKLDGINGSLDKAQDILSFDAQTFATEGEAPREVSHLLLRGLGEPEEICRQVSEEIAQGVTIESFCRRFPNITILDCRVREGASIRAHWHKNHREHIIVLEGELLKLAEDGSVRYKLNRDTPVDFIPETKVHTYRAATDCRYLVIFQPSMELRKP